MLGVPLSDDVQSLVEQAKNSSYKNDWFIQFKAPAIRDFKNNEYLHNGEVFVCNNIYPSWFAFSRKDENAKIGRGIIKELDQAHREGFPEHLKKNSNESELTIRLDKAWLIYRDRMIISNDGYFWGENNGGLAGLRKLKDISSSPYRLLVRLVDASGKTILLTTENVLINDR